MKTKYLILLALIPLGVFLEMLAFNSVTGLISMPSDMAVAAGVLLLCLLIGLHIFLIKQLIKSK